MSTRRLRDRAPSAKPLEIARLDGHRLAWHKVGRDGSAKCDIQKTGRPHDSVWGVLFAIAEGERPYLDRAEGLGRGYAYKMIRVLTSNMEAIEAGAYYATHIDASLRPFDWYLAFVLAGAREHGLPESYARGLNAIAAVVDPDAKRCKRNRELLQNGQPSLGPTV